MENARLEAPVTGYSAWFTFKLAGFINIDTLEVVSAAACKAHLMLDNLVGCFPKAGSDYAPPLGQAQHPADAPQPGAPAVPSAQVAATH